MSMLIPATKGYSVIVDDADYPALARYSWYAHNCGGRGYKEKRPARRTSVLEGRKVLFLAHHIARAPDGMVVDHIDGNPWNNQRDNLRICTQAENAKNRKKHGGDSRNPFKGVYPRGRRFEAKIASDGHLHLLGTYGDARDAARAYDCAALFLHGEFARLNFDDGTATPIAPAQVFEAAALASHAGAMDWEPLVAEVLHGGTAADVAGKAGVSHSGLCRAVKSAGGQLKRGRPRRASNEAHPLLAEIESFCAARNLGTCRFGALSANERGLVGRLRTGTQPHPKTIDRVRRFMAESDIVMPLRSLDSAILSEIIRKSQHSSYSEIAREYGFTRSKVAGIIFRWSKTPTVPNIEPYEIVELAEDDSDWDRKARVGSARLAAAISRLHGPTPSTDRAAA